MYLGILPLELIVISSLYLGVEELASMTLIISLSSCIIFIPLSFAIDAQIMIENSIIEA